MASSAFAVIPWFFLGLNASKWIGLPQFASAMQKLQHESRTWGIASLILEAVALALSLYPRTQHESPLPTAGAPFAYVLEKNRWVELVEHWFVRAALCILGTIGLVIFFGVIIYFWDLLLRA